MKKRKVRTMEEQNDINMKRGAIAMGLFILLFVVVTIIKAIAS